MEVKVGIEMIIMTLEVDVETEIIEEERNHDCMRCYRCWEYDHFVAECPNTPTDEETDPASLQMMSQNYSSINSEREADYLNL